ncbi:Rqt4 protein [Martiniozyma asiatica (nom. inval.)]|nr:Rqt4 protein [Martiniozyma asiatica]
MSKYTRREIVNYATEAIGNLLPIDNETIQQMIDYALLSLKSRESVLIHFGDLLGHDDDALKFSHRFADMLFGSLEENNKIDSISAEKVNLPKSEKPKLGTKSIKLVSQGGKTKIVRTKTVIKDSNNNIKSGKQRLAGSNKSTTTSELFTLTPKQKEKEKIKNVETKRKLNSLEELEAVINELEVSNKRAEGDVRICNCNATRHQLFEMYPNCLNCGKIICEREGLQPCSFCGKSLMPEFEREQVIKILNKERKDLLDVDADKEKRREEERKKQQQKKKKNVMKISLNSVGQNNFKVQEQFFKLAENKKEEEREKERKEKEIEKEKEDTRKEIEYWNSRNGKDEELRKAEERLELLLSFQDNGAERTKIIDNAADFESSVTNSSNGLWASPLERALQLKRQQKVRESLKEKEEVRSGRGQKKMDVVIRDGKVIMRQSTVVEANHDDLSDDEDIKAMKKEINSEKMRQFNEEAKVYYDYEENSKQFVKPIYLGDGAERDSKREPSMGELPEIGNVVQLGDAEEQENALFSMVGV